MNKLNCAEAKQISLVSLLAALGYQPNRIKAKNARLSVSEYIREMALKGKINTGNRTIPKEILRFTATLNHLVANLNQVAKKRNRYEVLTSWNGQT